MKSFCVVVFCIGLLPALAFGHLCNDVFAQAKDNLAVKVDVRDDQLRVNGTASFRVYLLNTMDRDIANIQLEVQSPEFNVEVKPSADWKRFPALQTKKNGGQKEFFDVKITRKPDTAQGKYKIGLRLFNGDNKSMEFKTVDVGDAVAEMAVPAKAPTLKIDGNVEQAEWENALLCTSLYEYKKEKDFNANCNSNIQTRFRFSRDDNNLYSMIDFQTAGKKDSAKIYISKDSDTAPIVVVANPHEGKAFIEGKDDVQFNCKVADTKMEIEMPLEKLNVKGQKTFCVNMTREQDDVQTYWRGNSISVSDPVVYAIFVVK
jgi:hypothetical protein